MRLTAWPTNRKTVPEGVWDLVWKDTAVRGKFRWHDLLREIVFRPLSAGPIQAIPFVASMYTRRLDPDEWFEHVTVEGSSDE